MGLEDVEQQLRDVVRHPTFGRDAAQTGLRMCSRAGNEKVGFWRATTSAMSSGFPPCPVLALEVGIAPELVAQSFAVFWVEICRPSSDLAVQPEYGRLHALTGARDEAKGVVAFIGPLLRKKSYCEGRFCLTVFRQERWITYDAIKLSLEFIRQAQRLLKVVKLEIGAYHFESSVVLQQAQL